MNELIEYMKIHLISLEQDMDKLNYTNSDVETFEWHYLHGSIETSRHLLSVAEGILKK